MRIYRPCSLIFIVVTIRLRASVRRVCVYRYHIKCVHEQTLQFARVFGLRQSYGMVDVTPGGTIIPRQYTNIDLSTRFLGYKIYVYYVVYEPSSSLVLLLFLLLCIITLLQYILRRDVKRTGLLDRPLP